MSKVGPGSWVACLLLFLILLITYLGALQVPLLLDDLSEWAFVGNFHKAWDWLGPDCYHFFRPVKNLFFSFFHTLGESHLVWAHATSLILLLGSVWLLSKYASLFFPGRMMPLWAAGLWAIAPTQASVVSWLSCINILAMITGLLGCLLLYERYRLARRDDGKARFRAALMSAVCLVVALISYEAAVVTPVLILLHDGVRDSSRWRERSSWTGYLLFGVLVILFLVVRSATGSRIAVHNESMPLLSGAELSFSSAYFFMDHFYLWWWPFDRQTILGTFNPEADNIQTAIRLSWGLLGVLVLAMIVLRKRAPLFSFGMAWYLVAMAPLSNIVPLRNGPLADYYLALPSIGLSLVATAFISAAWNTARQPARSKLFRACALSFAGLAMVWVGFLLVECFTWVRTWRSEEALLTRALETHPGNYNARANLARLQNLAGQADAAEQNARRVLKEAPWSIQGHYALSGSLKRKGDFTGALAVLMEAIKMRPRDPTPYTLAGHLFEMNLRQGKQAEEMYSNALLRPWNHEYSKIAAMNLGDMLYRAGRLEEAVQVWSTAATAVPGDPDFQNNLCVGYLRLNQPEKALRHAQAARKLGAPVAPGLLTEIHDALGKAH